MSIYKTTSLEIIISSIILILCNFFKIYAGNDLTIVSFGVYIIPFFLILFFFFFTYKKETYLNKMIQVLIIFLSGVLSLYDAPYEYFYIGLWTYSILLLYKYDFFIEHPLKKIIIYVSISIVLIMISCYTHSSLSVFIFDLLQSLVFFIVHVFSLFILFFDTIKEYEQKIKIKRSLEDLGEKTMMIVHDSKNALQKIYGGLFLLKQNQFIKDEDISSYIKIIEATVSNMNDRFNFILESKKGKVQKKLVNLISLLDSIIYMWNLNKENNFKVIKKYKEKAIYITLIQSLFVDMLNNIIKNAIEANALSIELDVIEESKLAIIITDNGTGINKCFGCEKNNCINCELLSSKQEGHGIGFKSIKDCIKQQNMELTIQSSNKGTIITIYVKRE